MAKKRPPRPYQKKARAEQEEATRKRIVEAVVDLHRTVGPAKTTIKDVADRAGVGRVTVYKHFPRDKDMFAACGAHWFGQNPPPDFSACLTIDDHPQRCACILRRLYSYYPSAYDMMGKVEESWMELMHNLEAAMVPKTSSAAETRRLRAAIRVALDLNTWKILTDSGLTDGQAAELALQWIAGRTAQRRERQ